MREGLGSSMPKLPASPCTLVRLCGLATMSFLGLDSRGDRVSGDLRSASQPVFLRPLACVATLPDTCIPCACLACQCHVPLYTTHAHTTADRSVKGAARRADFNILGIP